MAAPPAYYFPAGAPPYYFSIPMVYAPVPCAQTSAAGAAYGRPPWEEREREVARQQEMQRIQQAQQQQWTASRGPVPLPGFAPAYWGNVPLTPATVLTPTPTAPVHTSAGRPRPLDTPRRAQTPHRAQTPRPPPALRPPSTPHPPPVQLCKDRAVRIDPLLAFPHHHPNRPGKLHWDMMHPPSAAWVRKTWGRIPAERLECAAIALQDRTDVHLRVFVLVFPDAPACAVRVRRTDGRSVGVGDLMDALYVKLQQEVSTQEELYIKQYLGAVEKARHERLKRYKYPQSRRPIKIDYLGKDRMFMGIRKALKWETPREFAQEDVFIVETDECE
ncbi:uncharacterized protein BXZ73DRAFT_108276 [Epithele typhae]|uniref:uncharacterized protein n=1 Tax=Epithele typhae TaxID=378194 RepID=UPI002007BF49|nr:uncharacterized protein BXZ73DRAFT_108276 [Epithele typhae]KAH9911059.1 hypothetical protein BXZ73DRAFT_108276 [Epithele typhae]